MILRLGTTPQEEPVHSILNFPMKQFRKMPLTSLNLIKWLQENENSQNVSNLLTELGISSLSKKQVIGILLNKQV